MNISFNMFLGGLEKDDGDVFKLLHKKFHNIFTNYFENKSFGEDLEKIKYYFYINGNVSIYFPETGIISITHYSKSKEMRIVLCIANSENKINCKNIFKIYETLLKQSSEQIIIKSNTKKLNFNANEFYNSLIIVLGDIKNGIK